ncbi:hypothetical protein RJ640_003688 [Escallonia rubra]|uniref:Transcriptional factor DELLA N-terminal domain-containing protein n=1 Tax=Escallonia rubra TaxID=112253 RepID=A0AA88TZA5_9ASTE|nr:hypothetical protein RJ640_003688 [Escallonia rubra]
MFEPQNPQVNLNANPDFLPNPIPAHWNGPMDPQVNDNAIEVNSDAESDQFAHLPPIDDILEQLEQLPIDDMMDIDMDIDIEQISENDITDGDTEADEILCEGEFEESSYSDIELLEASPENSYLETIPVPETEAVKFLPVNHDQISEQIPTANSPIMNPDLEPATLTHISLNASEEILGELHNQILPNPLISSLTVNNISSPKICLMSTASGEVGPEGSFSMALKHNQLSALEPSQPTTHILPLAEHVMGQPNNLHTWAQFFISLSDLGLQLLVQPINSYLSHNLLDSSSPNHFLGQLFSQQRPFNQSPEHSSLPLVPISQPSSLACFPSLSALHGHEHTLQCSPPELQDLSHQTEPLLQASSHAPSNLLAFPKSSSLLCTSTWFTPSTSPTFSPSDLHQLKNDLTLSIYPNTSTHLEPLGVHSLERTKICPIFEPHTAPILNHFGQMGTRFSAPDFEEELNEEGMKDDSGLKSLIMVPSYQQTEMSSSTNSSAAASGSSGNSKRKRFEANEDDMDLDGTKRYKSTLIQHAAIHQEPPGAGYRVLSSELWQVARCLETVMVNAPKEVSHLANDAIHYNPSDVASWVDSLLSKLHQPKKLYRPVNLLRSEPDGHRKLPAGTEIEEDSSIGWCMC